MIEALHGAIRSATRITADRARGLAATSASLGDIAADDCIGGLRQIDRADRQATVDRRRACVRLHEPLDDPIFERMKADHDQPPPLRQQCQCCVRVLPAAPQALD